MLSRSAIVAAETEDGRDRALARMGSAVFEGD
jgi:hypothetical protein